MNLAVEALTAEGRSYSLADALFLHALDEAGDNNSFVRARAALAALRSIDEDQVLEHRRALLSAIDAWRSGRQLYSAEETEAFLCHHALTKQELAEYLLGELARVHASEHGIAGIAAAPQDAIIAGARAAAFAGGLDEIVSSAALRIGLAAHHVDAGRLARAETAIRARAAGLGTASLAELCAPLGIAAARAEELLGLEARLSALVDELATPEALACELARHALPLTVVRHALVAFATREAAAEALVCVRHDGADLLALADRVGAKTFVTELRVEQLLETPNLVPMAYALAGEAAGPSYNGIDAWDVAIVLGRDPPTLAASSVADAVRHSLVQRVLRPRVSRVRRRRVGFDPTARVAEDDAEWGDDD